MATTPADMFCQFPMKDVLRTGPSGVFADTQGRLTRTWSNVLTFVPDYLWYYVSLPSGYKITS